MDVEPPPSSSTAIEITEPQQLDHYLTELNLSPSLLKSLKWLYQKERSPKSPIRTKKFWKVYSNPRFHMFPTWIKDNVHHELEGVSQSFDNVIQLLQKTDSLHFGADRLPTVDIIAATISVRYPRSNDRAVRFVGSCMRDNKKNLSEIAKDANFQKHFAAAMDAACKQPLSNEAEEVIDKYLSLSNLLPEDQKSLCDVSFGDFNKSPVLYSKHLECDKEAYQRALLGIETFRNFLIQPKASSKSAFEQPTPSPVAEPSQDSSNEPVPKPQSQSPATLTARPTSPFQQVAERITRNTPGGRVILGDAIYKVENGYAYLPDINQLVKLNSEYLYLKSHACGKFHYFDYTLEFNRHGMPTDLPIELQNPYKLDSYSYVIVDHVIRMLARGYYFCNGKLLSLSEAGITGMYISKRT